MNRTEAKKVLMDAGLDEVAANAQIKMVEDGIRDHRLHDSTFDILGKLTTYHWGIPHEFSDTPEPVEIKHEVNGKRVYLLGLDSDVQVDMSDVKILCDIEDYSHE
jgi:hypothetical protein